MEEHAASPANITVLLRRWQDGDAKALAEVTPLVYRELHQIAARYLARERHNHTLQSTALVHEAFLRLVDQRRVDWQSRTHFFALAAQLMRRILVDHARHTSRLKRGALVPKLSLDESLESGSAGPDLANILSVDQALDDLERKDPRQARIVELRFFAGLTLEETAEALNLSTATIKREWTIARAWLFNRIGNSQPRKTSS